MDAYISKRFLTVVFAIGITVMSAELVHGQNYPTKTIRLLTSEAGGGTDYVARLIAHGMSGPLGQIVIVDNRRSGQGLFGKIVVDSAPDGYTLLVAGSSFWIAPLFEKGANYDALKDLSPITLAVSQPNILVVHPSVPVKSVTDLIQLARSKPGALNYASSGIGTSAHMAAELFKSMSAVNMVHVPYRGSGQAIIGLLGGQVQVMFGTSSTVAQHIKSGKVRALAAGSARPSVLFPDLPTVAASGLPGFEAGVVYGVLAPAKTSKAVINQLNHVIVQYLQTPEAKERFLSGGSETLGTPPQALTAAIQSDLSQTAKLIKIAGISVE